MLKFCPQNQFTINNMKKLVLITLLPLLTSCMAANIAYQAADLAYTIKGESYEAPKSAKARFEYFDQEKETVIPPLKKYFQLISKNKDYISFSASESTDKKDCFVGLKFYKSDIDQNIATLQQFVDWSKNPSLDTNQPTIQLKTNNGKLTVLSFTLDKQTKQPLLTYSGSDCDLFSSKKYYAVNPDNVSTMIEEIKYWNTTINQ